MQMAIIKHSQNNKTCTNFGESSIIFAYDDKWKYSRNYWIKTTRNVAVYYFKFSTWSNFLF